MSGIDVEDGLSDRQLTSAELPDATIRFLNENLIGEFKVQIRPKTLHPEGDAHLSALAKNYKIDPPRQTTPAHADGIDGSFIDHDISTHDSPIIVVVPDNEWRDQNGREDLGLFTFEEALAFLANADNLVALTEEDCIKLMLILLDGRARMLVLLREYAKSGRTFECFFRFYKAAVLSHRQALYELLQGKNNQHSHFALRSQPTFGNQLQSIYRIRNGSDTARMTGGIPKDIETSFYNFASSHARTLSALEPLTDALFSHILNRETAKTRVAAWFDGFGAAAPLLFVALDTTLSTFKRLDPARTIFDSDFYFFFSKFMKVVATLKLPLDDGSNNGGIEKKKVLASEFATNLRKAMTIARPKPETQLSLFKKHLGTAKPPWRGVGKVTIEMAEDFFARLEALIVRLESSDVAEFELEVTSGLVWNFLTYEELISFNPRIAGTAISRSIATCESHILNVVYEVAAAYLQLSRNDSSLHLQKPYASAFRDAEPFIYALVGGSDKSIAATAKERREKPKELWYEEKAWANVWVEVLRTISNNKEEMITEFLAAKARVSSLSDEERKILFDHFVHPSLQLTDQGKAIREHLHILFFRVEEDRSLTPVLPPPSYERCIVWLRNFSNGLLKPLATFKKEDNSNLFGRYLSLVEKSELFPILDCPSELESLIREKIVENKSKSHQDKLAAALDSALPKLESLKTNTLLRPNLSGDEEEEEKSRHEGDEGHEEEEREKGDPAAGSGGDTSDVINLRQNKGKGKAIDQDFFEDGEADDEGEGRGKEKKAIGAEGGGGGEGDSSQDVENVGTSKPRRKKNSNVEKHDAAFKPTTGNSRSHSTSGSRPHGYSPPVEEVGLSDVSPALETSTSAFETEEEPNRSPSRSPTPAPPAPSTINLEQNELRSPIFDSSSISAGNEPDHQPPNSRLQDSGPSSSSAAELGARSRDSTPNSSSSPALNHEGAQLDNAPPSRSSKANRSTSSALEDAEEDQRSVTLAASSFVRGDGGAPSNSLGHGSTTSSALEDDPHPSPDRHPQLRPPAEEEEDLESKLAESESLDRRKSTDTVISETDAEEDSEGKSENDDVVGGAQSVSSSSPAFKRSKSSAVDLKPIDPRPPSRSVTLAPSSSSANGDRERELRTSVQSPTPGSSTSSSEDREELRPQSRYSTPDASVSLNEGAQIDVDSSSRLSTLEFSISFAPRVGEQDPRSSTLASTSFASSSSSESSSFAVARVHLKDRFPERFPARLPSTSSSVRTEEEDVLASSRSVTLASSSRRRDSNQATTPTFDSSSFAVGRDLLPHLYGQIPSASSSSTADTSDSPSLSRSVTLAASSLDGEAERSQSHSDSSSSDNSLYLSFDKSSDQSRSLGSDNQSSQEIPANVLPGWTTARRLRDDQRRCETLSKMSKLGYPLVCQIVKIYHQSNEHSGVDSTASVSQVDPCDFAEQFENFLVDRASVKEGEADHREGVTVQPIVIDSVSWARLIGVATVVFFTLFQDGADSTSEVYQFWLNFGADFVRDA